MQEVADAYFKPYQEARRKRAEWAILNRLGLESASDVFLRGDLGMRVASDLINFKVPSIEAIIAGSDDSGPHIYQVNNQGITCQDWVGFASIGVGATHANSQFMFAGHTRQRLLPETLMLVYRAKKRAEVAPGVGTSTDMFLIEPPGKYFDIGTHVIDQPDGCYRGLSAAANKAMEEANGKITDYIKTVLAAPVPEPDTGGPEIALLPAPAEPEGPPGHPKPGPIPSQEG